MSGAGVTDAAGSSLMSCNGRPRCSVVISTRDRPHSLAACLRSVSAQGLDRLELVIADSASRSRDALAVASQFGARYLYIEKPGLSRARNAGAREGSGEIIVFLDDDVTLAQGCLAAILEEFIDPRVAAVGGRIVTCGGEEVARNAFEAFGGFDPGPERRVIDSATPSWFELVNFGGLGSGAMFAVRRSILQSWTGFDERLGRGAPLDAGEEIQAYFALVSGGHRVAYTPRAVSLHPAPESLAALRRRILQGAAASSAYMTLLLVECPGFRRQTLRYALEALTGKRREWRPRPATARIAVVPRWRERLAWLIGPLLYVRMRAIVGLRRWAAVGRARGQS